MARPWFRMYSEFVSDPKVQLLAFEDQRHFVALLCLKCNDVLDSAAPSPNYRDRMLAKALGLSPDAALEAKRRLLEVGLIDDDWQPVKWEARQYEHDVSTSRVRDWRAKKKKDETFQKQPCNVSGTTEIQNRTDTEQRRGKVDAQARLTPGLNAEAWEAFTDYRRSIGKPLKPASMTEAAKKLAAFGKDQGAVVTQTIANGWQGLFALKDQGRKPEQQARASNIPDLTAKELVQKRAEKVGFREQLSGEPDFRYEDALKDAERQALPRAEPKFAVVRG